MVNLGIIDFTILILYKFTDLPDGLCPVAPSERQECGYSGITKEECLGKSCCWDPTVPDTKWCFKQPGEYVFSYHSHQTDQIVASKSKVDFKWLI